MSSYDQKLNFNLVKCQGHKLYQKQKCDSHENSLTALDFQQNAEVKSQVIINRNDETFINEINYIDKLDQTKEADSCKLEKNKNVLNSKVEDSLKSFKYLISFVNKNVEFYIELNKETIPNNGYYLERNSLD